MICFAFGILNESNLPWQIKEVYTTIFSVLLNQNKGSKILWQAEWQNKLYALLYAVICLSYCSDNI